MDSTDDSGSKRGARQWQDAAANDGSFIDPTETQSEARRLAQLMLDPPADLPVQAAAMSGLACGLDGLALAMPAASMLRQRIGPAVSTVARLNQQAARAEAVAALTRRKKYHGHYLALLNLGLSGALPQEATRPLAQMLGTWSVRLALDGWRPKKHALAKVVIALARPASRASVRWTVAQRQRDAADALHELRRTIQGNPSAAAELGFAPSEGTSEPESSAVEAFNKRFRRRMTDVLEYKSADDQAGAGGNGTLSAAGLKRAGRELMAGVRGGRPEEIHASLEVLSHLTSDLMQLLPVQLGSHPPEGALAWLDVPGGAYCHTQFKLLDRGARPQAGAEGLYEVTTQVVRVRLSPPLVDALQRAAQRLSGDSCSINELLGEVAHDPHDAVAGQGPYRATARKLQASLPALLLQAGEFRWTVALATSSPFVVSRGRPAYGVGRQADIDRVVDHAHDLLGWPRPKHVADETTLVGSFTTPKLMAVRLALAALAEEADATSIALQSVDSVIEHVNAHAAYLAMLLALCFALRDRVVYKVPTPGLRAKGPLKFNDKDVHEFGMPAVPMVGAVGGAIDAWERLLHIAVEALRRIGSQDALELAARLQSRLQDHETIGWVFTITVAHTLQPVGTHTWRDRLPRSLRLVGNFARQFWPHRLAALGMSQLDIDVLMRHQMPALHPGSSHVCRPEAEIQARLVAAMTDVLDRQLDLPVPRALRAQAAE